MDSLQQMEGSRMPRKPFVEFINKHLWMNFSRYLMQYVVFLLRRQLETAF